MEEKDIKIGGKVEFVFLGKKRLGELRSTEPDGRGGIIVNIRGEEENKRAKASYHFPLEELTSLEEGAEEVNTYGDPCFIEFGHSRYIRSDIINPPPSKE